MKGQLPARQAVLLSRIGEIHTPFFFKRTLFIRTLKRKLNIAKNIQSLQLFENQSFNQI